MVMMPKVKVGDLVRHLVLDLQGTVLQVRPIGKTFIYLVDWGEKVFWAQRDQIRRVLRSGFRP